MTQRGFYERLAKARAAGGSPDSQLLQSCINRTVTSLLRSETNTNRPGMLLGKIQSGKTRAFLGVIAGAFDQGFDVALILTKGTKSLAQQTVNRVSGEFAQFRDSEELAVYDIMNVPNLTEWEINRFKLVFVAKKEVNNLRRLIDLFKKKYPSLAKKRVLIVDDEADFASIRFSKAKGSDEIDQGKIAAQIDEIRNLLNHPALLQVTATPYSLYLQPTDYQASDDQFTFLPKRPAFTELVPVHEDYVGGDEYFGDHDESRPEYYLWHAVSENELAALKKPDRRRIKVDEALTSNQTRALRHSLFTFVTAATIRRVQQQLAHQPAKRYSMIVHTETTKQAHSWQLQIAQEIIDAATDAARNGDDSFNDLVDASYDDLCTSLSRGGFSVPSRDTVRRLVGEAFEQGGVVMEKVNSDNDLQALLDENAELKLRTPYNVFIGGQILDRGITVPNLLAFYYGRSPKRMQQDTVLQHARMYGARPRPDLAVSRLYTTPFNHEALRRIHQFDSALRHAFESGAHERGVAFVLRDAKRIVPCAPSKIMASSIVALGPNSTLLPYGFQTKKKTELARHIRAVERTVPTELLATAGQQLISCQQAVDLISAIEPTMEFEDGYSFDWDAARAALEYFARIVEHSPPRDRVWLYVFKERNLSRVRSSGRFSNAPLSPQERGSFGALTDAVPILAMIEQQGLEEDGWCGHRFWWPVVIAPATAMTSIIATSASSSGAEDDL